MQVHSDTSKMREKRVDMNQTGMRGTVSSQLYFNGDPILSHSFNVVSSNPGASYIYYSILSIFPKDLSKITDILMLENRMMFGFGKPPVNWGTSFL